jgi:hypothetical protein
LTVQLTLMASAVLAQSPNTASIVVTVVDQNDAVVKGANVSVVNMATGAAREAMSGDEGTATISGLPLTGQYKVSVAMTGFTAGEVNDLTLRSGETAQVKVKLLASGGQNEVTVYGTTQGIRADPQIGLPGSPRKLQSVRMDMRFRRLRTSILHACFNCRRGLFSER